MLPPVVIKAMSHYYPGELITNEFFSTLEIDSDAEWIESRTGIKSRHSVLGTNLIQSLRRGETSYMDLRRQGAISQMAPIAAELWQAGKNSWKEDLVAPDLLISGTSVPDYDIPASASFIAKELGFANATTFDVNSACSSFVSGLLAASSILKAGSLYKTAAIFNIERYSTRLNYADRQSCILFGDGAALTYLTTDPKEAGLELKDIVLYSTPLSAELVQIPVHGCFDQNGKAVQKFAVQKTVEVAQTLLERNDLQVADLRFFIGHQANLRMLESVGTRLGLAPEQHPFNVDRCGNQGGAGAPSVLSEVFSELRPEDKVLVAVVGAGLTFGGALFEMRA